MILLSVVLLFGAMAVISINRENTFSIGKYSIYNVLTESMLPTFGMGSIIVVEQVPQSELKVGDIITFYPVEDNSTVLTHRIVNILNDGGETKFQTQGDNNNIPERNPISYDKIIGKVVFYANGWGNFLLVLRSPVGITVMIGITVLLMVVAYISDSTKKKKEAARAKRRKTRKASSKTGRKPASAKNTAGKRSASESGRKEKTTAAKTKKRAKKTEIKQKRSA